jgi:hypothetical protein
VTRDVGCLRRFLRQVRRLDLNLPLICLFLLPAFHPLLKPTLTLSSDGLVHLYRLVALDHAVSQGVLFPRWMPDLVFGYGLPLFVYYPPLSYYIAELPHALGLHTVFAMNASLALSLLVGAWGIYLFVRDLFNPTAGLLAAIAYAYAPFQLLNLYSRGSPPTAWGMAFFPLVLWACQRLIRAPRSTLVNLLLVALSVAVLFLTHNITTLIFSPLLGGYLLVLLWSEQDRQRLGSVGLALTLGVTLAAFFLLPAMAERSLAQLERLTTPPDFDYHFHFLAPSDLLSLPPPINTGHLNPEPPSSIGLPQLALALLGLGGLWRSRDRAQRGVILFSGLALAASIFMLLPASVSVWDHLPLLAFVQRPSRLLSLPAFLMAVLSGALLGVRGRDHRLTVLPFTLTIGALLLIIGGSLSLLYPRYYELPSTNPTLLDMMAYEHTSGTVGTTSFGEYLPVWVRQVPVDSPLEPLYRSGAPLDRLDRAYLPVGVQVKSVTFGANHARLTLISPEATQLVFHTFYFPGWRATVNGQKTDTFPVSERGLLGLSIPAGESRIRLRFGETSIRLVADVISVLGVTTSLALAVIVLYQKWRKRARPDLVDVHPTPAPASSWRQIAVLAGLALALTLTKSFYLDRFSTPFKRQFNGPQDTPLQVQLDANFGDQFTLLGYDLPHSTVTAGGTLDLTLYWQSREQPIRTYSSLAQLIDSEGNVVSAQDNLHPGQYPTNLWRPWGYVTDPHSLSLPPDTPPGQYILIVGLYEPDTWRRLPVVDPASQQWTDVIPIGPVTVVQ